MSKLEKYKYATIILSMFVVVMIVVMLNNQKIVDNARAMLNIKNGSAVCQKSLGSWSAKYKGTNGWNITPASTAELAVILDSCQD